MDEWLECYLYEYGLVYDIIGWVGGWAMVVFGVIWFGWWGCCIIVISLVLLWDGVVGGMVGGYLEVIFIYLVLKLELDGNGNGDIWLYGGFIQIDTKEERQKQ